jgi:acyl carrier protein phosphodiesterase
MNYLAHLFLSDHTPESLIGNLLGDFRKGLPLEQYSPAILQGLELHQKVDIFTDSHPIVHQSKQLMQPQYRRFAGIMLDVLYDHFLSKHWQDYTTLVRSAFIAHVYRVLVQYQPILPQTLQRILPDLIANDWLGSYGELAGVDRALCRIARRFKHPTPLGDSCQELLRHYRPLEVRFQQFFPDLMWYVDGCRATPDLQSSNGVQGLSQGFDLHP